MKFAVNYSPVLAHLIQQGAVRVDVLKCADFPEMIEAARSLGPVYVHFGLECGNGAGADLASVDRVASATQTRLINTHLVRRQATSPGLARADVSATARDAAVRATLDDLAPVVAHFGPSRVMIENLIYHGDVAGGEDWQLSGVDARVFRRVTDSVDVGLLLDVSHARIACHYAGWDIWEYLGSLPTDRLRELHITGLAMHNGLLTDHMPMTEPDWAFADEVFRRIRRGGWPTPEIVALEYGGTGPPFAWRTDPAVLAEDVPRLAELIAASL